MGSWKAAGIGEGGKGSGLKLLEDSWQGMGGKGGVRVTEESEGLSATIFSMKKFRKLSQRAGEGTTGDSFRGFMREFRLEY